MSYIYIYIYIVYYIYYKYIYVYIYYMYINAQKLSNKIKVIISMISKSFHIFGYLTSFLYILGFVEEIALTQV